MPKNTKKLILVTGATGHQGGAVLKQLQKKGFPVRILTRDPTKPEARKLVGSGTEISKGDLNDQATLTRALDGVHGVFSVQAADFADVENEVRQGINLAAAASRSRISHLVYSSAAGADKKTGVPHFDSKFRVEEHIRGTGMPYTILRPAFFMENWIGMRDQLEQGVIAFPMRPETRLQMVAVDDIGGVVVTAFERPGIWQGRTVELAGDEMSLHDLAETFSRVMGRRVEYQQVPWDKFEQQAGRELTLMFRWLEEVGLHVDIDAVRQDYPDLMTFERWLHSHFLGSRIAAT